MRVLSVVHEPDAGPGVFTPVLAASGHDVEEWRPDLSPSPRASAARYDATLVFGGAMHVDHEGEHPGRLDADLCRRFLALAQRARS